jgi:iron complex outermembrane recepter protein
MRTVRHSIFGAIAIFVSLGAVAPAAFAGEEPTPELFELDVEDLMNVKVTSVSKKLETYFDAPSAITVITQEDIRRSGLTSIPELLRLVPGLQVARINGSKWAISARGFNDEFANKLLVLIDGRTVYTPAFSGVHWDVQDVLLEDIERIEVIRGPGATLWGANAVNGVINVITKSARDTQGGLVTAAGGTEERASGGARYGGQIGRNAYYRVYLKYFDRDGFEDRSGNDTPDDWHQARGGFRLDWARAEGESLRLQGDLYGGHSGQIVARSRLEPPFSLLEEDDLDVGGGNLLARWERALSTTSSIAVQGYYDRTQRYGVQLDETRDVIDVEAQHRFRIGVPNEVVWGLGYRHTGDRFRNEFDVQFVPRRRHDDLFAGFVQIERVLVPERLKLTAGTKLEHNDYTGFEVQPSARVSWTPHAGHAVWAAVSRAVRTPSRANSDLRVRLGAFPGEGGVPAVPTVLGNRSLDSETMLAYELGYRVRPFEHLFGDVAAFYNDYEDLTVAEPQEPFLESDPQPLHVALPLRFESKMSGRAYGVELATTWTPTPSWRVIGSYSWFDLALHSRAIDREGEAVAGDAPHNQFQIRSILDLPHRFELDGALYYVDNLPSPVRLTPSYLRLDVRLGWRPRRDLELSLVGQNLTDSRHGEFKTFAVQDSQIQRSLYGKITWRFDAPLWR